MSAGVGPNSGRLNNNQLNLFDQELKVKQQNIVLPIIIVSRIEISVFNLDPSVDNVDCVRKLQR